MCQYRLRRGCGKLPLVQTVVQILNLLTLLTSPHHKEGGEALEVYVVCADWFLVAFPGVFAGEGWVWF